MLISEYIPLPVDRIIDEIIERQGLPWNNGRINDYSDFALLQQMFCYMNKGIPTEEYFFRGNLYRIHSSYPTLLSEVDNQHELIVHSSDDGSCRVLPVTEYSDKLVSFSKDRDFTRKCYNKIYADETAIMFYCNTRELFGLDVNDFLRRYGVHNERFEEEKEVLFPLMKNCIIREYTCSPNQFNYYLRNINNT